MATTVLGLKTFAASDPVDYNEINDNYVKIDNGVKTALKGRAAHNLLDNSDFRNPVNQRGQTSYTGAGYTIDRWKAGVSDCVMYVNAGKSVAFNTKTEGVNAYWRQYLPHSLSQLEGKTFTLAIKDTWGNTHCASGVYPTSAPSATKSVIWINMYENVSIVLYCATDGTAFVQLSTKKSVPIVWAALYEGSYDASTLPAYQPKGYAAELAECQRSYIIGRRYRPSVATFVDSTQYLMIFDVQLPQRMRIKPTATIKKLPSYIRINGQQYSFTDVVISAIYYNKDENTIGIVLKCSSNFGSFMTGHFDEIAIEFSSEM